MPVRHGLDGLVLDTDAADPHRAVLAERQRAGRALALEDFLEGAHRGLGRGLAVDVEYAALHLDAVAGRPTSRLMKSCPLTGWRNTATSPRSGSEKKSRPSKGHIEKGQEWRE